MYLCIGEKGAFPERWLFYNYQEMGVTQCV